MSIAEIIYEKAKVLPLPLPTEALHYLDFLETRQSAEAEAAEWSRFSASQLEKQYGPQDAIYDQD